MSLEAIEIRNLKSLTHVDLQEMGKINVLIGRNNVGKSSVFTALDLLVRTLKGAGLPQHLGPQGLNVLSFNDNNKCLEIRIRFVIDVEMRRTMLNSLCGAVAPSRLEGVVNSPMCRRCEFVFKSHEGQAYPLILSETRIPYQDGEWESLHKHNGEKHHNSVQNHKYLSVGHWMVSPELSLTSDYARKMAVSSVSIPLNLDPQSTIESIRPFISLIHRFITSIYIFSPFRRSQERIAAQSTNQLAPDGQNLASFLSTLQGTNRDRFDRIENFIRTAIPSLGRLHIRLEGTHNLITFQGAADYQVHLHEHGGGIEQLLMIAALLETGEDYFLCLEEPESHLHPTAQRLLIERLAACKHPVVLTTHSPIFINPAYQPVIYQVTQHNRVSTIRRIDDANSLSELLVDIGVRNSDVLLTDGVVFVEGESDKTILESWCKNLDVRLSDLGISFVLMGGGRHADRHAPIRSGVLAGITSKSPIPHLFVLDRDERTNEEVEQIKSKLGEACFVCTKREIENYLLVPHAILSALKVKYSQKKPNPLLDEQNTESLELLIKSKSAGLFLTALTKRIRARIKLPGENVLRGVLNECRDLASDLDKYSCELETRLQRAITEFVKEQNISSVVKDEVTSMKEFWNCSGISQAVPGEEVLVAIYKEFGGNYDKTKDGAIIASFMREQDIAEEFRSLITKSIASLIK